MSDGLINQQRERIAELERENETLKARLEVAEAGFHEAISKATQQFRTNRELNRLLAQIEDMKELCLTTEEVSKIKSESILDAVRFCNQYMAFPVSKGSAAEAVISVDELTNYSVSIYNGVSHE